MGGFGVSTVTDHIGLNMRYDRISELIKNGLVDIDTLNVEADLASIEESVECNLARSAMVLQIYFQELEIDTSLAVASMSTSGRTIAGSFPPLKIGISTWNFPSSTEQD